MMSLEGLHTWAEGVIRQRERLLEAQELILTPNWIAGRRAFERERYAFLMHTNRLIEYIEWATSLDFLDPKIFSDLLRFRDDVRYLRNKNEHVVEYFGGRKPVPNKWWHETAQSKTDASSTSGSKIGGRLDWEEVTETTIEMLAKLPPHYWPNA